MKLVRLVLVPFALLIVAFVRLVSPWILIRFGEFWSTRLGHLAGNTECYLCERDAGMHKAFDIWTHRGPICNRQLAKMWKRCLWVDPTKFTLLVSIVNRMFQGWEKHTVMPTQLDRDIHNLFEKYPPHLKFTAREERRGQKGLRELGIPEGAKFVCLIVRDGTYLPQLGYHNHRDTEIKDYLAACLALTQRGYYVLRMGAMVKSPMLIKHTKIIDYATSGKRTDFMDVYLGAKCDFCISTGTGFDAIPYIFRRPVCFVNYVMIEYLFTFSPNSLAIWKHHVKDGKRMTPAEIFEVDAGQFPGAEQFKEAGISLENNSPAEITALVLEMADLVEGKEMWTIEDVERRKKFWRIFPRSISPFNGKLLHGEIRMEIGREFLRSYD